MRWLYCPITPQIIERIYVPVYPQTPETAAKIAPVTPANPDISAPPLPAAPQVNRPLAAVIPTNNQVKNTLVGVMDLGDRSSALFESAVHLHNSLEGDAFLISPRSTSLIAMKITNIPINVN